MEIKRLPETVIFGTALLLVIAWGEFPYGFYLIVKNVAFLVLVWAFFNAYKRQVPILPFLFIVLAVIYNPVQRIYLFREAWQVINVVAAVVIILSYFRLEKLNKNQSQAIT